MKQRLSVALLTLSFAAATTIMVDEHFTTEAVIPIKGDRPTVGFGSTFHADGTPVRMGDRITPVRAVVTAQAHLAREERVFRQSLQGAQLSQAEYDLYMDWVYQYGTAAWNRSSMRREILAGNYDKACDALLLYKYASGYDCSVPGNKVCAGVWTRQLNRHERCISAQ